jgi:hypothetical protein
MFKRIRTEDLEHAYNVHGMSLRDISALTPMSASGILKRLQKRGVAIRQEEPPECPSVAGSGTREDQERPRSRAKLSDPEKGGSLLSSTPTASSAGENTGGDPRPVRAQGERSPSQGPTDYERNLERIERIKRLSKLTR